jgi:hypothetical protein
MICPRRSAHRSAPFFYCTRSSCLGIGGFSAFENEKCHVRIVQPQGPSLVSPMPTQESLMPPRTITGWTPLVDLPAPEEHKRLGLRCTYDFRSWTMQLECPKLDVNLTIPMKDCNVEDIASAAPGDKLAGWPAWMQTVDYPKCPECRRRMVQVFQVESRDNIPFMFGDLGRGHIMQCPTHKEVVGFCWACS